MSLWKLHLSVVGTLAAIIGLSTLFFTAILWYFQILDFLTLGLFVVFFNLAQWLLAPYLIDAMYRVKEVSKADNPELHATVERLSEKSGIKKPRVMVANIPVPNAFAYGSPIAGTRVAVTSELLKTLDGSQVEAVLGHELGHLKHRDVQVMMFVSILPALFYYIGFSMMMSNMYGRQNSRDSGSAAVIIGIASMAIYWVLTMFTLYLSRLREYFADRHSASVVDEGPRKLSEALAKIQASASRMKQTPKQAGGVSSYKALFIADPDKAASDTLAIAQANGVSADRRLVEEVLRKRVTTTDRLLELFSTHPNMVKRLQALQEIA